MDSSADVPCRAMHLLVVCAAVMVPLSALGLDCPPMPRQAQQDWESEVKIAVGKVGAASGPELEVRTRRATSDLLGKLPHADKVYLEQMLFASYCSALRDNPALGEGERESRVWTYSGLLRQTLGTAATAAKAPAEDSRDAARKALERLPVPCSAAALHKAIEDRRTDVVDLFLQAGMDPNSKDREGSTALERAAGRGASGAVQALLRANATLSDEAVSRAADQGHVDIVRMFLARGLAASAVDDAFVAAAAGARPDMVALLAAHVGNRRAVSSRALPAAVWSGDDVAPQRLVVVRALLGMGADVDAAVDREGRTALTKAAEYGLAGVVQELIAAHADVGHVCACDEHRYGHHTPLTMAADHDRFEAVAALLNAGAAVDARTSDGLTPLMLSVGMGADERTVRLLLDHGADPNARDAKGNTALLHGLYSGKDRVDVVRLLVSHGADVNIAGHYKGQAALASAAAIDHVDSMEALLSAGADVNARDADGGTPLMIAVRRGSSPSVRLLIKHGSPIDAVDHDGKTALDHARDLDPDMGRSRIAALLRNAGAK